MLDTSRQSFGGLAADSYGTDDERPALVLLHGLTYDRRTWEPTLRELAAIDPDRRVVALDLPGHGGSPRRESYDMSEIAAVVYCAVSDGLDAPVLAGHSFGSSGTTRRRWLPAGDVGELGLGCGPVRRRRSVRRGGRRNRYAPWPARWKRS